MSGEEQSRSPALAAAAVVIGFALVLLALPSVVLWIGDYSPVLATIVGTIGIMSFFIVLWLRARYQRRHAGGSDKPQP
ncbi:hypothetical protein NBH19_20320 [Rhizobium sp. S95]|uniref:Uncharacterized protein n=1 Tax=Ciceribacter sichuanensis TaxID=2949647 RepID=A0AAJ1F8N8_9HYPH|nr:MULTISPECIES: hypothetical protein [unclassified Ciceribacter]MCM2398424.1 hypothetical protein [Ciceribacter sp. S95]MCO5958429.1 hypothetical protein [Ciceribacter sp. S101]